MTEEKLQLKSDSKIKVSLFLAILVAIGGGMGWISEVMDKERANTERKIEKTEQKIDKIDSKVEKVKTDFTTLIISVTTSMAKQEASISNIERNVQYFIDKER